VTEYSKDLVSPTGKKYTATSPREANDLIFGSGYREVDTTKPKAKNAKADTKSEETT